MSTNSKSQFPIIGTEQKLLQLTRIHKDVIYTIDGNGRFKAVNPAASTVWSFRPVDLIRIQMV